MRDSIQLTLLFAVLTQVVYLLSIFSIFPTFSAHKDFSGLITKAPIWFRLTKIKSRLIWYLWLLVDVLACLFSGDLKVFLLFVATCLSRYFFVYQRYRGMGRGFGAPGFMSYWTLLYVFLFELGIQHSFNQKSIHIVMALDFGLVMLSAALYKSLNGYFSEKGIEYGLVNPMWSRFPRTWVRISKKDTFIFSANVVSVLSEFVIAILLFTLKESAIKLGGSLLIFMFCLLLIFVKLGTLPLTMVAIGALLLQDFDQPLVINEFQAVYDGILVTYMVLLFLSFIWVWFFEFKIMPSDKIRDLFKLSYELTGFIIWSVFTYKRTEKYLTGVTKDDLNKIHSSVDYVPFSKFDVHKAIALATLATFRETFPTEEKEWQDRVLAFLTPEYELEAIWFGKITKIDKAWRIRGVEIWYIDRENNKINQFYL